MHTYIKLCKKLEFISSDKACINYRDFSFSFKDLVLELRLSCREEINLDRQIVTQISVVCAKSIRSYLYVNVITVPVLSLTTQSIYRVHESSLARVNTPRKKQGVCCITCRYEKSRLSRIGWRKVVPRPHRKIDILSCRKAAK